MLAIALGTLAGGLVGYAASLAFRLRVLRRADSRAPQTEHQRPRIEVIGAVCGAVVAGFAAPFVTVPWAVGLAGLGAVGVPVLAYGARRAVLSQPHRGE